MALNDDELADVLATLPPDKVKTLYALGKRRAIAAEATRRAARLDDPPGTVRFLSNTDGGNPMFLVRRDDDYDEEPYWQIYVFDNHGIEIEDGDFDPAYAPVIGRLP